MPRANACPATRTRYAPRPRHHYSPVIGRSKSAKGGTLCSHQGWRRRRVSALDMPVLCHWLSPLPCLTRLGASPIAATVEGYPFHSAAPRTRKRVRDGSSHPIAHQSVAGGQGVRVVRRSVEYGRRRCPAPALLRPDRRPCNGGGRAGPLLDRVRPSRQGRELSVRVQNRRQPRRTDHIEVVPLPCHGGTVAIRVTVAREQHVEV